MSDDLRWVDLSPDSSFVHALDAADSEGTRAQAMAEADATKRQSLKRNWSNRLADAAARMVASEVRKHAEFKKSEVGPMPTGPAEPMTFLVGGKKKRIDVVVSSPAVGLQLGVSLKGMNFRDTTGLQFDKNLTGRTYELENELRVVRETLPRAFMAALYFVPVGATDDKRGSGESSFARIVQHLRARLGRVDPHAASQWGRLDFGAVALYSPGDTEDFDYTTGKGEKKKNHHFHYLDDVRTGVVRYFDVRENPPRRGRPRVETTVTLPELVGLLVEEYRDFVGEEAIDWADAEKDSNG